MIGGYPLLDASPITGAFVLGVRRILHSYVYEDTEVPAKKSSSFAMPGLRPSTADTRSMLFRQVSGKLEAMFAGMRPRREASVLGRDPS